MYFEPIYPVMTETTNDIRGWNSLGKGVNLLYTGIVFRGIVHVLTPKTKPDSMNPTDPLNDDYVTNCLAEVDKLY